MHSKIAISIIIPVYNVEKYIKRCLCSVLNQTLKVEYEIILINDCTPDLSINIINEYLRQNPPKKNIHISIYNHKNNLGLSASRLTGINKATGEYIIHIDSDDYIDNDMLEKMYNKAIATQADFIMVDVIKEYKNHTEIINAPYYKNKNRIISDFIKGIGIYQCNKLIKRSLYLDHISFIKEGYDMSEDYSIIIPISYSANKIEYVSNSYYHYIQYNSNAITKRKITQREINGWLHSIKCLFAFFQDKDMSLYKLDIMHRLITIKYWCMLYAPKHEQYKYLNLFPEINEHLSELLKQINGKQSKIKYYLVAKGYKTCFNLFIFISKLLGYKL